MLDYALRYRKRGFSVIPCKKDKRPYVQWEPYQLQKPSEDEIRKWWTTHPDANIAIVCGQVSGVDVLDLDTEQAFAVMNDFYLPDSFSTPTVKTPKGRHLYFKHRSGLSNKVRAIPGTDLRTMGGYVIAPPSKNGDGNPYYWLDGLTPKEIEFAEWPENLFSVLEIASHGSGSAPQGHDPYNSSIYREGGVIGGGGGKQEPQTTTGTTNDHKLFGEGQRDNDLFHVANCLVKGKCEPKYINKVLELLALNCDPPFDPSEIPAKIQSAINRKVSRERHLSSEVREWVSTTNGHFSTTNGHNELQLTTKEEKKNFNMIMLRLVEEGVIEKSGGRNGEYRLIDQSCQPMDWVNASCEYLPLWMPLNLGEICGVQPGNILVFAGAKDSGKTAWLLNMAKENRHDYKVHYFNSEMGPAEFKLRASLFPDVTVNQWEDVHVYERSENFADVIKPGAGNLNIIDFLEVVDEFWKVAATIQKIHQKLNGALCIIALQKNPGVDLGRGGAFSLEKARLYVSLDYQNAKIISCKNFKENDIIRGNPRGYTCKYKLVAGCRITRMDPGWSSPIDKGAK
jgi:hypothetical protein